MTGLSSGAVDDHAFAQRMAALGPFEPRPHLAIAVSGGVDSLALALLAKRWIDQHDGTITALTVDHALRPASIAEATWVASTMARWGIAHQTLRAALPPPRPASQVWARELRYRLLDEACRRLGCLHLLVAHHSDDQAETRAMRWLRSSGAGTSGMAAIRELRHVRILRPLLTFRRERLRALVALQHSGWILDPSNHDPRYERTQLRGSVTPCSCSDDRPALERQRAGWLARHARIDPAGSAQLDGRAWQALSDDEAAAVLRMVVAAVGRRTYGPSPGATLRIAMAIRGGGEQRTLGGTLIRLGGDGLWITPERATATADRMLSQPVAGVPFAAAETLVSGRTLPI
ncbi:MAG: tRNA lysidine(34) synthetase TilS [Pseudomonadota bacterium]